MKRIFTFIKKVFIWAFVTSLIYTLLCIVIMPPLTITQVSNSFNYGLKRDYISWDEMGKNIKWAAIASEDQAFADHNGFDWDAIEKSLKPKPSKKRKKSKTPLGGGASTISQQVAKNVFLWQGSGISKYIRKAPEFYFTFLIELCWSKKRILEVYLNTIEMGPGVFGIEAAAQHYFKKSAKNLSKEEAAKIVACFPNPKIFGVNPMSRRVAWRYPQIIREMNHISDDEDLEDIVNAK
ncbi:MAG: monofunctional biosynthetic peptidoglycan transglycosylase [Chitinophagaceae bacterium]|jgi:monofunctional biosynthetic peptidoglycan transglycosylase